MTRPLVIRPAAEQDMAEARAWYEDRQAGLGDEFLAALDIVFARIGDARKRTPWNTETSGGRG